MKKIIIFCSSILMTISLIAQVERPKLVVGLVVDQMRYDFLYRYYDKYSEGGFKRLLNKGFSCANTHYNYVPTFTGPGHTSIYTGSTPAVHGIISNNWYVKETGKMIYCAEDTTVQTVGTTSKAGWMSPRNMITTTICDQLKMATNQESKVIGIALKDRGAILPAGHTANAAYWYDGKFGDWISSTFYMKELPTWVKSFNEKNVAEKYIESGWNTLLPIEQYTESTNDNMPWEELSKGETNPTFPHKLPSLESIKASPYGNTLTADFTKAAVLGEKLGMENRTDFLAVSFSSTDYVGHAFGPNAIETEDTYLRLDLEIASLLTFLDEQVGKGKYTVFLTADHGVSDVPEYASSLKIPAGVLDFDGLEKEVNNELNQKLGAGKWISSFDNDQFFLNYELMQQKNIKRADVVEIIQTVLMHFQGVQFVLDLQDIQKASIPMLYRERIINGCNQKRSGDVQFITHPNWITHGHKGTTHGSAFNYDTHIPVLFYGFGVSKGKTVRLTNITDIAPTIAQLLHILEPNGCIGQPIGEALK